jgi:hypothetical protein
MNDDLIKKTQIDVYKEQKNKDGIPLIAVGLFLIIVSIFMAIEQLSLVGIFVIFIPIVTEGLRKRYTYPRIGFVKLPESNKGRLTRMWLVFGLLVLGLVVMLAFNANLIPSGIKVNMHLFLMWFIAFVLLSLLAVTYLRDKNIIYLWFGAFILFFALAVWLLKLHIDVIKYIILGFGLVNLAWGLISLCSFIKKYPVLKDEE